MDRTRAETDRELIAGRFEVRRRLGTGGMGVVYGAYDRERGHEVALKFVVNVEPSAVLRLKQEFRVLADVRHPNLVELHELLCADGTWFFTMELVEGLTLLDWVHGPDLSGERLDTITTAPCDHVARGGPIAPGTSVRFDADRVRDAARQLALGLAHLHQQGYLHRDVKPANILVDAHGRVVLCDFSIARALNARGVTGDEDVLVGTVPYMSPEQAAGKPQGTASDWYAFGAVLFECLTGRVPFVGEAHDVLARKQTMAAPSVLDLCTDAPPDLAALCQRLLRTEPGHRPGASEVLASFGQAAGPIWTTAVGDVVGRERELAELDAALDQSAAGVAVTTLVHGDTGSGKTTLLRQFVERASGRAVALYGRCYQRESVPFKAFDTIVDALSLHLAGLPRSEAESMVPTGVAYLARLFPVLRRVRAIAAPPLPATSVRSPGELQRRAFAALRELLANLARRRPIVFAIDDVHWGDLDSARLLRELTNPPDAPPILLVLSFPSADRHAPMLAEMLRVDTLAAASYREVDIAPLAGGAALALARAVLGEDAPASHPEMIANEAQGNPLLVTVLARWLRRHGNVSPTREGDEPISSLLQARVDRLDPTSRSVLAAVALAGRPVATAIALQAADVGAQGPTACAELRLDHVLRACTLRSGDDALDVYHERIRVAAVARLEPTARRALHERLALAAEASLHPDHEFLADHWSEAGHAVRAASHAREAAERATEGLAFARAARLYRTAIDLAPDAPGVTAMRVALGDALADSGRGAEAAEVWTAAAAEASTEAAALELRRRAAQQWLYTGHADRGLTAIRDVLGTIGLDLATSPRRALAGLVVRRALARVRGVSWRRRDASQIAPETLSRLDVFWAAATGLSMIDTIRGADFQTRHLALALATGEPRRVARALAMEAAYTSTAGSASRARAASLLERAAAVAADLDDPQTTGFVTLIRGTNHFLLGEWASAAAGCLEAERIFREQCTGVDWELTNATVYALSSIGYMGDLATLRSEIPRRIREAEERGNRYMIGWVRCGIANLVLLAAGRVDELEAHLEEATAALVMPPGLPQFQVQHYFALWSRCQIAMFRGDGDGAARLVHETWPALRRSLLLRVQYVRINATHLRARCELAAARSSGDPRRALGVPGAIAQLRREHTPLADAMAAALEGGLAAIRGDAATGASRLEEATAGFRRAGMALFARAARYQRARVASERDELRAAADELRAAGVDEYERIASVLVPV